MDPLQETLAAVLDRMAEAQGARTAVLFREEARSYAELAQESRRLAGGLAAVGLRKGERLAVWLPSDLDWVRLELAAARLGLVLVPISTRYKTSEAAYILRQSEAAALVLPDAWHGMDFLERLGPAGAERFPALRRLIVRGHRVPAGAVAFRELAAHEPPGELPRVRPEDPLLLLYTSGTTGFPKGALLSHRSVIYDAFHMGERQRFTPADRLLLAPPLFHVFGCVNGVIGVLTHGGSLVVQEVFEPGESLALIERHRCTAIYSTATMFQMLLEHPDLPGRDRRSLRTGMIGSMPVPDVVMRGIVERLAAPEIANSYGQTEASVSLLTEAGAGLGVLLQGVGPPLPGVEVKIVDPASGARLPAGEEGEICVRGPHVMLGYHRMPEKTAEAIDGEGWLHSGDLAREVGGGLYRITGRLKDMYIHGGLKVYPAEVENVLYQHPAVLQAAVVGVPDPRLGEVGHAFVQRRPGAAVQAEALVAFVRERLASYKVPRAVTFVDEFPLTANGKIQKFRLREQVVSRGG
ncbi:MAG: AMP-binding protein [Candidatus Methylomirabilales bacterium]